MKILLAVDGQSDEAAAEIASRPWPPESVVRVISVTERVVAPMTEFGSGATVEMIADDQKTAAARAVAAAAQRLRAHGLTVETAVLEGSPQRAIVDDAESWNADLIVVGSHEHSRLERLLLGSVADAVVDHAKCSVEVVRHRRRGAAV